MSNIYGSRNDNGIRGNSVGSADSTDFLILRDIWMKDPIFFFTVIM